MSLDESLTTTDIVTLDANLDELCVETDCDAVDGTALYLHGIGQYAFLKREEEIALSRSIQAGQLAEVRLNNCQPISRSEETKLRRLIAAARKEAARLGIWCGLPAERPDGWSDAEHLAEDLRLADLIQAGRLAAFTMTKEPALSKEQQNEFAAQVTRARLAAQNLGVPWSKTETASQQLERLELAPAEKERVATLFANAQDAYRQLQERPARDDAEQAKLERAVAEAHRSRNTLVERNLRLVVNVAKRYVSQGVELDDLTSFGNLGLIEGAEKYDWRRGTRFSTYASLMIRQHLLRGMSDTIRPIRLPTYRVDEARKITRMIPELSQKLGRTPATAEVAEAVGSTSEEVHQLLNLIQPLASLDQSTDEEDDELTTANALADPDVDVVRDAENDDLRRVLQAAFRRAGVDKRTLTILKQRFELNYTLDQIARAHGLSRERVRQLIAETKRALIQVLDPTDLDGHLGPEGLGVLSQAQAGFADYLSA